MTAQPQDATNDDITITMEATLVNGLSCFAMDFFVKKAKTLGSDEWNWRQFTLRGQQLVVAHMGHAIETFNSEECDLVELPSSVNLCQLICRSEPQFIFFCPSATIRNIFISIFHISKTTPYWIKPASTLMDDLVDVANCLLEIDKTMKMSRTM